MIKKLTIEELKRKYNNDLDYSLEHAVERIKKRLENDNYEININAFNKHDTEDFFRVIYPNNEGEFKTTSKMFDKKILSLLYIEEKRRIEIHNLLHPEKEFIRINKIYNKVIRIDKFANGEKLEVKGNDLFYNGNKIYQEKNVFVIYEDFIELIIYSYTKNKIIKIKIDKNKFEKIKNYTWCRSGNNKINKFSIRTNLVLNKKEKTSLYNTIYENSEIIKFCLFDNETEYIDYTLENINKRINNEILDTDKFIYKKRNGFVFEMNNIRIKIKKYSKDKNKLLKMRNDILIKIIEEELI